MPDRVGKTENNDLKAAIEWFVALQSDNCTEQQRQAFDRWLDSESKNVENYQAVQNLWLHLDPLKTAEIPSLSRARRATPKNRLRKSISHYSSLVLLLAVAAITWQDYQTATDYVSTGIGEYKQLELPDKSRIILNANTRLQIRLSWLHRQINLLEGEAQFSVTHHALRPFSVKTGPMTITDIGTVFNVRNRPENKSVAVLEGEVDIRPEGKWRALSLQAGFARGFTAAGNLLPVEKIDPIKAAAWVNQRLTFNHTPLSEVATELERHHPVRFVFRDARIANQTLSGNFDAKDLSSFIQAVEQIYPVRITRKKQLIELSLQH